MGVTNPNGNVLVQIETHALPPKSELNPAHYPANGVRAECTKCGACALANPEREEGGPVTRRRAAIKTALRKLEAGCQSPREWGLVPRHEDRRIPRGVTLWVEDRGNERLWPLTVNERGKLECASGGVGYSAVIWVIPDTDATTGDAIDFAQRLGPKPAPVRKAKPAAATPGKKKRKAKPRVPKGYTDVKVGKPGTAPKREAVTP